MNPDTGFSMPIPEAMEKGHILVEFTNSSIERDNIQKGILTTTTTKEAVTYTVQVRVLIIVCTVLFLPFWNKRLHALE